ncbi:MAG: Ig-like domain-containing protein [Fibrobacterales bacterium]
MKIIYAFFLSLILFFGGCELFDSSGYKRDYTITITSDKDVAIDSIVVLKTIEGEQSRYEYVGKSIQRTSLDSITEQLTVNVHLATDKKSSVSIHYWCFSQGIEIIEKLSDFKIDDSNVASKGDVDSLMVDYVKQYNRQKQSIDPSQTDSAQIGAILDKNVSLLQDITSEMIVTNDSGQGSSLYYGYKAHTAHQLSNPGIIDTLTLLAHIRDSILVRGGSVDSLIASILGDSVDVSALVAQLPEPIKVLPDEPVATFSFSGSISLHAESISKIELLIYGDAIEDTVVRPTNWDVDLKVYTGFIDLYEQGDQYGVIVKVYGADSTITGVKQKQFDRSKLAIPVAAFDAWNAMPYVELDEILDMSIGDVMSVTYVSKDSLYNGGIAEVWWKQGEGQYVLVDSTITMSLPKVMTLDYPITIKVVDNDGNTAVHTRYMTVLLDAPVVVAGDSVTTPVNAAVSFHGSATQQFGSIVEYRWDFDGDAVDDVITDVDSVFSYIYTRAGEYLARFTVMDDDSNVVSASKVVTITNSKPVIDSIDVKSPDMIGDTVSINDSLTVSVVIKDSESNIDYARIFKSSGDGAADTIVVPLGKDTLVNFTIFYSEVGVFTPVVEVVDTEGLSDRDSVVVVVVQDVPQVSVEKSFTSVINMPHTFEGSAVQRFGSIVLYSWDYNNDGVIDDSSAVTPALTYTFKRSGTFSAKLYARDDDGNVGVDSLSVIVTNSAPQITKSCKNILVAIGGIVTLAAVTSDEDGGIESFKWDLDGDGVFEVNENSYKDQLKQYTIPGLYTVRLEVIDGDGKNATSSCVVDVNDPPLVADQVFVRDENSSTAFGPVVVGNNDNDILTYSVETSAFSIDAQGMITPLTGLDFETQEEFVFIVTVNDRLESTTGTVTVRLNNLNDNVPEVQGFDGVLNTPEETPLTINMSASDRDNDELQWRANSPVRGVITPVGGVGESKQIIYTPEHDFTGLDSFTVWVNDGEHDDSVVVFVEAGGVDDPAEYKGTPIITGVMEVGETLVIYPGLCTDVDSEIEWSYRWYRANVSGQNGVWVSEAHDSIYVLTGDEGAQFIYVEVSCNGVEKQTVYGDEVNAAPSIYPEHAFTVNGDEDADIDIPLSASDINEDNLTWRIIDSTDNGRIINASGSGSSRSIIYRSNPDWHGIDHFTIQVSDGRLIDEITVSIDVEPVNDAPYFVPNNETITKTVVEDGMVSIDIEAFDDSGVYNWRLFSNPGSGDVRIIGSGTSVSVEYSPHENSDVDDQFVIEVNDGTLSSTKTIEIDVTAVNDAPEFVGGNIHDVTVSEDGVLSHPVTIKDDNENQSWEIGLQPNNGTVSILSHSTKSRTIEYTPKADYYGDDSFKVRVTDGPHVVELLVNIDVESINDAPVINNGNDISIETNEDVTIEFDVPVVDDGPEYNWSIVGGLNYGAVTSVALPNDTLRVTYVPFDNSFGDEEFTIRISDGSPMSPESLSDEITVKLSVNSVNDAPVIDGETYYLETDEEVNKEFELGVPISDIENDPLVWNVVGTPENGALVVLEQGYQPRFEFQPYVGKTGYEEITLRVSDGEADDLIVVRTEIIPGNDKPIIDGGDRSKTINEDSWFEEVFQVTDDSEPSKLMWSIVQEPSEGGLDRSSGIGTEISIKYTANHNSNGTDSYKLRVTDGELSDTVTVSIDITPINDPPTFESAPTISGEYIVGKTLRVNVLCTDVEQGELTPQITWFVDSVNSGYTGEELATGETYEISGETFEKFIYARVYCDDNAGGQIEGNTGYTEVIDARLEGVVFDHDTGTITDYLGQETVIIIPREIDGVSVISLGVEAFKRNELTSVTIPSSVTSIGDYAFFINELMSVTLPSSVISIGISAFGANHLTSVTLPSSVTSIGDAAFSNNELSSVTLPSSVTFIGYSAFYRNELTSVTIPSSVTSIGSAVFRDNRLTSVTIPSSVTSIGVEAFTYNHLTSVTIPSSVTSIGNYAFMGNELMSVTIPSSVTSIGYYAFMGNELMSVTIPSSVTFIDVCVFSGNQLTSVTIGGNVDIDADPSTMGENSGFQDFYNNGGQHAGTYIYNGGAWSKAP